MYHVLVAGHVGPVGGVDAHSRFIESPTVTKERGKQVITERWGDDTLKAEYLGEESRRRYKLSISKQRQLEQTLNEFSEQSSSLSTVEGAIDPVLSQFWQKLSISLKSMAALNVSHCNGQTVHFDDVLKDYSRLTESGLTCLDNRWKTLEKLQDAQKKMLLPWPL